MGYRFENHHGEIVTLGENQSIVWPASVENGQDWSIEMLECPEFLMMVAMYIGNNPVFMVSQDTPETSVEEDPAQWDQFWEQEEIAISRSHPGLTHKRSYLFHWPHRNDYICGDLGRMDNHHWITAGIGGLWSACGGFLICREEGVQQMQKFGWIK